MRKLFFLLFCSLFLLQTTIFSQWLSGKVTAETGMAASKVNVSFADKRNKIITNADGSFKIFASKLPDTLVFSSPGFEPYKVEINDKNVADPNFEVVLLNKRGDMAKASYAYDELPIPSSALREVVVTGYSSRKKKEMTGSTSTYTAPGLTSGEKIRIRGASSISGDYSGSYTGTYAGKKINMLDSVFPTKDSEVIRNQMLTAGEVNDFYKWKMWGDLSDNEFKTWSNYWGMNARKRFSVQLQNSSFAAIINQSVYLVNKKTNEKVWSAVTDNTGKAELWAGFNGKEDSTAEYIIQTAKGDEINPAVSFEKGINHLQTNEACGASDAVDIAFVVDATGSMGDEIEFLKFGMEDVIRNTFNTYNKLNVKVGSVFYRDRGDEYVTKYIDFQSDLLKVLNFVKLQRDGGGGDEPEAVDSALYVALNQLSWRKEARTRLLFLVLDAPPHDYAKEDVYKLVQKAAAMGIRIIPIACSGSSKMNEFLLRSMALATNGTYTFLTDHSGIGGKHTEPTTDTYNVEFLNGLLQRIIQQFVYVKDCASNTNQPGPIIRQPENILKVKIFPNPTQGNIILEANKKIKEVYVADFTGKLLQKLTNSKGNTWTINIGNYPSGTYLLKYITADDKWGAEKVVLVH